VSIPLFFGGVDVENFPLLAVNDDVQGRYADSNLKTKTSLADINFVQYFPEIVRIKTNLQKFDSLVLFRQTNRVWIDDRHFVEFEVPFDQRDRSTPNRAVADHTDFFDVAVYWIVLHFVDKL